MDSRVRGNDSMSDACFHRNDNPLVELLTYDAIVI